MQTQETLTYLRYATEKEDGKEGFLYRYSWATGYEDLIFTSVADAGLFRKTLNGNKNESSNKQPA